jgi:hypothetical protein
VRDQWVCQDCSAAGRRRVMFEHSRRHHHQIGTSRDTQAAGCALPLGWAMVAVAGFLWLAGRPWNLLALVFGLFAAAIFYASYGDDR